jgi:hypothetical protein
MLFALIAEEKWSVLFGKAVQLERTVLQAMHEEQIERQTAELGADAEPTLQSKTALAALLRDMDQPAAALEAQRQAVSGLLERLGPVHADVLRAQSDLAEMLMAMQNYPVRTHPHPASTEGAINLLSTTIDVLPGGARAVRADGSRTFGAAGAKGRPCVAGEDLACRFVKPDRQEFCPRAGLSAR